MSDADSSKSTDPIARFARGLRAGGYAVDDVLVAEILWMAHQWFTQGASLELSEDDKPSRRDEPAPQPAPIPMPEPEPKPRPGPRPKPGQTSNPNIGVYVKPTSTAQEKTLRASPLRVPRTAALPAALEIGRALRPFGRRWSSAARFEIDIERTVEVAADTSVLAPVLRPVRERWFDIALVVDESLSMALWSEAIAELTRLLARHGAFRDLRRWSVRTDDKSIVVLSESGLAHHPRELVDPAGRRLIVIVSDSVGPMWNDAALWSVIAEWGSSTPTVLFSMLPDRFWTGTAIGTTSRVSAQRAGLRNRELDIEASWWFVPGKSIREVPLPVVNLEPAAIAAWTQMVMGGSARVAATMTKRASRPSVAIRTNVSAEDRVRRFKSLVSPMAYQLGVYLSGVPLTLPVMRLVQSTMLPRSQQTHLAEFFLGGLIRISGTPDASYDFYEGVREILQGSMTRSESWRVLAAISQFIESNFGSPLDFAALIHDRGGGYTLPVSARPFAELGAGLLARVSHGVTAVEPPTLNLDRDEGIERPLPLETSPARLKILVAGTSGSPRPATVQVARSLGAALAHGGYILLAGPSDGVDTAVAQGFAEALASEEAVRTRLLRYVYSKGGLQRDLIGTLVPAGSKIIDWPEADAAVLIGGSTGIKRGANVLSDKKIPLLPLPGTGGQARRISEAMMGTGSGERVERMLLQLISGHVNDDDQARSVAEYTALAIDLLWPGPRRRAYRYFFSLLDDVIGEAHDGRDPSPRREVVIFIDGVAEAAQRIGDDFVGNEPSPEQTRDGRAILGALLINSYLRLDELREIWPFATQIQRSLFARFAEWGADTFEYIARTGFVYDSFDGISRLVRSLRELKLDEALEPIRQRVLDVSETLIGAGPETPQTPKMPEAGAESTVSTTSAPYLDLSTSIKLRERPSNVRRIAWSPDGALLAEACYDGIVRIWDPASGVVVLPLLGPGHVIYSVSWAPDGSRIAAGGADESLLIWNVGLVGGPVTRYAMPESNRMVGSILGVAWSPDGTSIAISCDGGGVFLWTSATGIREVGRHDDVSPPVHMVAWSPDGSALASCGNDRTVRILTSGHSSAVLRGHTGNVYGLAWAPDGTMLASASHDGTIRLWKPDGTEIRVLHGHEDTITDLAFSANGLLASIAWDNSVKLWDPNAGRVLETLRAPSAKRFHSGLAFRPKSGSALAFATDAASAIEIRSSKAAEPAVTDNTMAPVSDVVERLGHTTNEVLDNAVRLIQGVARCEYLQIFLNYDKSLHIARREITGNKRLYGIAAPNGMIERAFALHRGAWAADVRNQSGYLDAEPSTLSEFVAPIGGLGVINLEFEQVDALNSMERAWLTEFGDALASRLHELRINPAAEILAARQQQ